jgi:TolB-like protein
MKNAFVLSTKIQRLSLREISMKKWLNPIKVLLGVSLLSACATENNSFYQHSHTVQDKINSYDLPSHGLNDLVKGLALQMLESSAFVNNKTPIAVTSFVNLEDLETTNWLGNQLAENFIYELQHHGLIVIDYKTTGAIRVTPDGDFVFSRDWQELPEKQVIDYVVSGTMHKQEGGILVNARMIGMQSHVVVASAQSFIPNWVLGQDLHQLQNVRVKDGLIIRDNAMLNEEPRAIDIHNN